jgi:hypothetical protein
MKRILLLFTLVNYNAFSQDLNFPTLSPASKISQEIGLTEINLSYARPGAKGRVIFGGLVPYGEIWRTGANASTQLTFTEDVKVGGNDLPAGTYALYTIPNEKTWTIIIHKNIRMRSLAGDVYKQENDAFRFEVPSINNPVTVETFTIQFTDITTESCNLTLSWANTMVKIPIEVMVDSKIIAQLEEMLKDPEKVNARTYFRSAEYFYHNDKDLNKALEWSNKSLELSPKNPMFGLLKAKILSGLGKTDESIQTITEAHQWAVDSNNSNYEEQTRLFMEGLKGGG